MTSVESYSRSFVFQSKKRKRDKSGCHSQGSVNSAASNISLGKDHQQDMMTATSILRNASSRPCSPPSQIRAESQQQQHTATINRHLHPQGVVKTAPPQVSPQRNAMSRVGTFRRLTAGRLLLESLLRVTAGKNEDEHAHSSISFQHRFISSLLIYFSCTFSCPPWSPSIIDAQASASVVGQSLAATSRQPETR